MTKRPPIDDLGRCTFADAYASMRDVFASIRAGESAGKILFAEHEPVFTAGRGTPADQLREDMVRIERGGQITYHGPGQLVVYPVITLPERDVNAWLRRLEAFGIAICGAFGLRAGPSLDGTGVFVEQWKVASIGVAIRHWINLHGIAVNVDMDLAPFRQIRPCGLDPTIVSDLSRLADRRIALDEARAAARAALPELCGVRSTDG